MSLEPIPPRGGPADAVDRRTFLKAGAALGLGPIAQGRSGAEEVAGRPSYRGPNIVIVRFGGGVRRQETIASDETYSPFLKGVFAPRGVLFPKMEIADAPEVETSHGQGTLYLLTGRYDKYEDVTGRFLGARFEPRVPTLFEGLRKHYDVPAHRALIVNGEDRTDEEFYTFSNHHLFGVDYRSTVLSLYRYKLHVLRTDLAAGRYRGEEEAEKRQELAKLESVDHRARDAEPTSPELDAFWDKWADYYGRSGLVNPRGDRLLAELAVWAMRELQPSLMMVNFNDPDYVHWGVASHYTRGVSIVDEGLRRLWEEAERLPSYRENTVFVVVPDCGRDSNPFVAVPFQHHFNAHHIFAAVAGPGIDRSRVVDKAVDQAEVAATVAAIMGFPMPLAEGRALGEVFA
ncbi:alkaline phosphatase family protein [Tautonia plasticadhaerens]|uniref:DUF1501 domain-containing protein n=1 Tax=Tautonia plasticadhaerens TaxID=2527974 RepID=A0A518H8V3_9BACT|nr:hypothetical protein [Tautonia plasticadhaerens]QDV37273.1 hypothetical protein ElP_52080 [Tautonia plasticadhaerens]